MQPAFESAGSTESLPRKCDCFLPPRIFVVSLRLPQRHDKLSFHLLFFFSFFFIFVEESVSEVLEVYLSRSWYAVRTDPPRLLVRDRCVSDHVQSTSGELSISPARVESPASRLGAGVKTAWDLSKLKSRC